MNHFKNWGRGALAAIVFLGTAALAQDVGGTAQDVGNSAKDTARKTERKTEEMGRKVGGTEESKADYLNRLALFDQEQIAWGEMAQQRATNPKVRQLGGEIARAHRQHLQSLQAYAHSQDQELAMVDLTSRPNRGVGGAGTAGTPTAEKERERETNKYGGDYSRSVKDFDNERDRISRESGAKFDQKIVAQLDSSQKQGRDLVERGLKRYPDDAAMATLLRNTAPVLDKNRTEIENAKRTVKTEG
jgi:putative membrane protein